MYMIHEFNNEITVNSRIDLQYKFEYDRCRARNGLTKMDK